MEEYENQTSMKRKRKLNKGTEQKGNQLFYIAKYGCGMKKSHKRTRKA